MRYGMILPMIMALGFLGAADSAVAGEPREHMNCRDVCVRQCPACVKVCDHYCKDSRTGAEFCCQFHCKQGTGVNKCCGYERFCN
ncbi:MAG: hypothetical protein V1723_00385 [Candidatus Uhrbacteria bacterium]